ncbi:DinB family protein [Dyadobacter chenwenxiniae]|uniref:DinB family protein n=1 Tax=Dyadobacter chenwenxiniae TaxID=2906456 RepID=A0A9X1PP77_9BACT|nr:DinB family protein [Dyadobacter chenwenxiniae]MCF0063995.1 DinB family protein [Dyadobacter chenwenxiniae]UON82722.1 DinB family protein [Dyadobacter chenwenxiniae]
MTDRKFPIGPFVLKDDYAPAEIESFIQIIRSSASAYKELVENLGEEDLAKTYREGSWNIRQLIHHVADIALLHYLRMKKAVTEPDYDAPTMIDMDAWAATGDSLGMPIADSLNILAGTNQRYTHFATSLDAEAFAKAYFHPFRKIWLNQKQALAMSVWHLQHHLAHIKLALGEDI